MSQTLTYVMGADNRALVDNVQDFHIDWNEQRNDNWITARQWEDGMRQVFVNIKNQDGTPFDLTGCNVWFEGFLPKSAKGDFRIIDDEGYVPIDESAGRFRFDMPKQAFPLAGSYRQAFFRILKNGNSVTTLEFDLKVLADKVVTGLVPRDWISPFERIADELLASFKQHTADADKVLNDFQNKVTDLINELNRQGSATTSMLTGLQNRIGELESRVDDDNNKINNMFDDFNNKINKQIEDFKNQTNQYIENLQVDSNATAYNTVNEMQHDNKLKVGDLAQTFGYYSSNDGGGASYKILDHPDGFSIELGNHLWAQQINQTGDNYYGDIKYSIDRDHRYHTTCYTITIPKQDYFGEMIMPEMNYHPEWISPNAWARQYHSTVTLNGDASIRIGPGETYMNGNVISGGKIIHQADPSKTYPDRMKSLAIMKDRSIREYQAGTSAQQMLNDGAQVAFTVYYPLVKNGQKTGYANTDNDTTDNLRAGGRVTEHHPALGIGEKSDGTWIVIGCDGRSIDENGLMADELAQKFVEAGCVNAWRMDGGGSESINYRGAKLNRNYDDNGFTDRKLQFTFDIRKPTAADNSNSYATAAAGEQKLNLFRQIMYPVNTFLMSSFAILGNTKVNNADELENFVNEVAYRLNESQMPQGAHLTGILTIPFTNSAIAQALGYPNLSGDFQWDYTCTAGNHNTGMFTVKGVNDHQFQAFRQFTKLKEPHWSKWYAMNQTTEVSGANPGGNITDFWIQRINNTVEFQCKIHADSNTWKTYITGLPLPLKDGLSIPVWGEGQNRIGFVNLDKGGKLNMRSDTNDTYNFHYTYLAKSTDYDIPY
ncbi:BppU family phage baseplate upper protein [Limosilactobacillus reuteri]